MRAERGGRMCADSKGTTLQNHMMPSSDGKTLVMLSQLSATVGGSPDSHTHTYTQTHTHRQEARTHAPTGSTSSSSVSLAVPVDRRFDLFVVVFGIFIENLLLA